MAKEKAPFNPYPIPEQHIGYVYGENYFTSPVRLASKSGLRPYVEGENPTRDAQIRTTALQERYRISHPNVARRMVTTDGEPNEDPMGEMRVSRNDKVRRSRDAYYSVRPDEADEYNTKLVRDQEEIDLSLEDLDAIAARRAEIQALLDKKKLFGVHKLSVALSHLLRDEEYLQRRATWLSGLRDSVQYKRADAPEFDSEVIREEHDYLSEGLLHRKSEDGTRLIDQLHESAAEQAQKALRLRESGRAALNGYDRYGRYTVPDLAEQDSDSPE